MDGDDLNGLVAFLVENGVDENDILANPYGRYPLGGLGSSAEVLFPWPQTWRISQLFDEVAETLNTEGKRLTLQDVLVVFLPADCAGLERQAWERAIEDATQRAEVAADLAGVRIASIRNIDEQFSTVTGLGSRGCAFLESTTSSLFVQSTGAFNSPADVEVIASLQVTFAVEPTT